MSGAWGLTAPAGAPTIVSMDRHRRRLALPIATVLVAVAALTACQFSVQGCEFTEHPQFPDRHDVHTATCPDWDLQGALLFGLTLFQANFAGADLRDANVSNGNWYGVDITGADLRGANLDSLYLLGGLPSHATFADASLRGAELVEVEGDGLDFTGADLTGAAFVSVWLTGATFTGTVLVPASQTVTATSPAGATVSWPPPSTLGDAAPGPCDHASGTAFPIGTTVVTCTVLGVSGFGAPNTGTFTVTVVPA